MDFDKYRHEMTLEFKRKQEMLEERYNANLMSLEKCRIHSSNKQAQWQPILKCLMAGSLCFPAFIANIRC